MRNYIPIFLAATLVSAGCAKASPADGSTIYDSNPDHLWNRLNQTLFERTAPDGKHYGLDQLDILYWARTTNLLAGASHQQALAVLDEFINTHGEKLIPDPLKKALLQRDLWALFDWAAVPTPYYQAKFPNGRRELASRLAVAIRRLALTTNEIVALPNNYALSVKNHLPDLPAGLFFTNGIWLNVSANNIEQIVPMHTMSFGGRSVFTVWFRDPDGHRAGVDYLKRLNAVYPLMVLPPGSISTNDMVPNPAFPRFPTNSQWALARCVCVIDTDGRIQPTHVMESIQLRTYLGFGDPRIIMVTNRNGYVVGEPVPPQQFNEFQLTRDPQASLISLAQDHQDFVFVHFMGMGIDAFENYQREEAYNTKYAQNRVLGTCFECHTATGIFSVNSFTRSISNPSAGETTHLMESSPEHENGVTIDWKQKQFNWGLLQDLWMQSN